MSKQNTRATIDANIKQNGQQQITGAILNSVLNTMVTDYAEQEKLTDLERKVAESADDVDDFSIVDDKGNTLAKFSKGEFKVKNFDTRHTPKQIDSNGESFDITDENGNILVRFKNGCIQTKNFNSSDISAGWWRGKKVAIIGDSISTNGNTGEDKNAVEITVGAEDVGKSLSAFLTLQDVQAGLSLGGHTFTNSEIGNEVTFTPTAADVGKVIGIPLNYNPNNVTTWWEHASRILEFEPIPVCWSGGDITSHRKDESAIKNAYAWHESQIRKCGVRVGGTMTRIAPDAIIIYRGTNDFSHLPYTKLTSDIFERVPFNYPTTDIVGSDYGFIEGYVLTIQKLRERYPHALIFCCTFNVFKRVNCTTFPTNNGINTLPQYNNAVREIADFMGCGLIEFDKDGVTFENCYPTYISDSATNPTHPNDRGHEMMAQKAIADMVYYIKNI